MKSIILFAMLLVGMAACETPQPATGSETTTSMDTSGTTPSTMSGDTTGAGSTTDTSTTRKDSIPQ